MLKELKKELSKLSGIDFFNPKYRDVFKKYFPDESTELDVNDNEEDRLKEVLDKNNTEEGNTPQTQEEQGETIEEAAETDNSEELSEDQEQKSSDVECNESAESEEDAEETPESKDNEQTDTDPSESAEGGATDAEETNAEETSEPVAEESIATDTTNTSNELLETKVELQLVKAGVREDRLEAAKKLFMSDIKSLEDLDKLKDLVKQYPEWLKKSKPDAKPFGMPIGDSEGVLTAEEKRLKAMGIDPKA